MKLFSLQLVVFIVAVCMLIVSIGVVYGIIYYGYTNYVVPGVFVVFLLIALWTLAGDVARNIDLKR